MRYNDAGFLEHTIGMPITHMNAFLNVARSQKCVILVRATGPTCHGLLAEGYDTKGYRIHGKSCDWGPMAGFVMRDPRLNKYGLGKAEFNREKHKEALYDDHEGQGWKAATTPLIISEQRIDWLRKNGHVPNLRVMGYGYRGRASRAGVTFDYALVRKPGGLYGVCFDHTQGGPKWVQETGLPAGKYQPLEPMLAMTNPPGHSGISSVVLEVMPHLRAITGDYDLFAVWPYVEDYDARVGAADHRPLGTVKGRPGAEGRNVDYLERNFTRGGQGTKLGNITNRIYTLCQSVNSIVGSTVLWHSDEAARPYLTDVDLPVIAFNPAGTHFGLETIEDFKVFIAACDQDGIYVTLSNAWAQDVVAGKPNRLGAEYGRYVPADGVRVIVPDWYNR
ncbi:anthrax toxin-like adenylyl cyclase domain-containing protein [Uliginosibacterium sp. H3]|uniref:Anthrax toxin-like adenylyl cyclase domain-containing protein n=1 Tax=Uliginosibacterium silvisoli TaxID=3114758 RepID=A0ABU6K765_9RHOO|nr:anthrax toxin-like adenylyl cyclase domain-containing protein [Uliginosibacterium sp. H3]